MLTEKLPDCPQCGLDELFCLPAIKILWARCYFCGWDSGPLEVPSGSEASNVIAARVAAAQVAIRGRTRHWLYVCDVCGTETSEMQLIEGEYTPSIADRLFRPDLAHIGNEMMNCPCGKVHTWYSVQLVEAQEAAG